MLASEHIEIQYRKNYAEIVEKNCGENVETSKRITPRMSGKNNLKMLQLYYPMPIGKNFVKKYRNFKFRRQRYNRENIETTKI